MIRPRRPTRAMIILFALLVAIVAVVIVVILSDSADDPELSAREQHGRELFIRSCARCHTLAATKAVGDVGPNLDTWTPWGIPRGVVAGAVRDGRRSVYSNARMPADLLTGRDVRDVAAFVATVTQQSAERRGGPPSLDWNRRPRREPVSERPPPRQTPSQSPQTPEGDGP